jgi:L-cystine uptake protein TcyP (sodium:dicarboxylate symporter family)
MITGRAWRDLPIVIILGLVIGLMFGQIVKLLPSEPTNSSLRTPKKGEPPGRRLGAQGRTMKMLARIGQTMGREGCSSMPLNMLCGRDIPRSSTVTREPT